MKKLKMECNRFPDYLQFKCCKCGCTPDVIVKIYDTEYSIADMVICEQCIIERLIEVETL